MAEWKFLKRLRQSANRLLKTGTGYYFRKDEGYKDLRSTIKDPREIQYYAALEHILVNLPVANGTGYRWFTLTEQSYLPYIVAARKSREKNGSIEEIEKILSKYASLVNMENANEALGLEDKYAVFKKESHPFEMVLPWDIRSVEKRFHHVMGHSRFENASYGLQSPDFLESRDCSREKIRIEAVRLYQLLNSVKQNGYIVDNKRGISARILVNGNDWRWTVSGGQHRAAVLTVLGYKEIPVIVRKIIRREEVSFWPAVTSGIYTKEAALKVFDRFYHADPPPAYHEWMKEAHLI